MSYKVEDIPGMIECFKLVTPELLVQERGFLCYALKRTRHPSWGKCRGLVREGLGKNIITLDGWHKRHIGRGIPYGKIGSGAGEGTPAWARMQWVEKIIRDLESYQKCPTK